ncbi:AAA family ATPase [Pelagicoccus sp. SDUM812002]|uniref:AAA family ATPase n=1 Tax=Pelagicoccus sp. SDUM812002 TaxID=3041266 RepID=UPI0028104851|nr:AAA family ATPase [Pelagicoccus sp. SDUM812002]MDQ8188259.1 AAA family ATPase [Pelagicoccus sp. SDUM812002]
METRNHLFIITGMPASGKTSLACALAKHTAGCLIDIDTATESIVRAAMQQLTGDSDDRDSPFFKEIFREPIYENLFAIADENLPHTDAILTGPFTREMQNERWPEQVQKRLSTPCKITCVFVHCDEELRRERLINRANPRDAAKLENWTDHLRYYDRDRFPSYPHFPIDTGDIDYFENALRNGLLD